MLTTESWVNLVLRMRENKEFDIFHGRFDEGFLPFPGDIVVGRNDLELLGGSGMVIAVNCDDKQCSILWSKNPLRPGRIEITDKLINSTSRKLKTTWSSLPADDVKAFRSIDSENELAGFEECDDRL